MVLGPFDVFLLVPRRYGIQKVFPFGLQHMSFDLNLWNGTGIVLVSSPDQLD